MSSSVVARTVACLAWVGWSISLTSTAVSADDYPARPIKIVSQSAAGSALDVLGRTVAQHLAKSWTSGVIIENRPGAGGAIAAQSVIGTPKDGYTLLHAAASLFTIYPAEHAKAAFDVDRDLIPVAHLGELPLMLAVPTTGDIATLSQLIAEARQQPGKFNLGTNGAGSFPHLAASLFVAKAGAPMTLVPYAQGGAPAILNDLLANRVHVAVEAVAGFKGAVASGHLRALAVMSAHRLPVFPDVPTVGETLPGFTAVGWSVLAAPAGTPAPIVAKINAAVKAALDDPALKQRLADLGVYPRVFTPAELSVFIQAEQRVWWPLVKAHAVAANPK